MARQQQTISPESMSTESMSKEQLQLVNQRWEEFFHQKKHVLEYYARGNQDLVSLGLLSVRKRLCEDADSPISHLLQRARLDMLKARGQGSSIDTPKLSGCRKYPLSPTGAYEATIEVHPEHALWDTLQYQQFWDSLTLTEQHLVQLLKEEKGENRDSWYQGVYVPVVRRKGRARRRFHEEVTPSETEYKTAYAHARCKFFQHFGSAEEAERERIWLERWDASQSLHASRNGKCARTAHTRAVHTRTT